MIGRYVNNSVFLMPFVILLVFPLFILSCSPVLEVITGTVTDIIGNEYKTVKIGDQWWMAENLRVTKYKNGVDISYITNGDEWSHLATGGYSAYNNNTDNVFPYGYLYNWFAVDDSRGICPEGWHVPSDQEWMELEIYLGMSKTEVDSFGWRGTDQGGKLKEAGTDHWMTPNTGATNETGFSALPSGGRASDPIYRGAYFYFGIHTAIWSSSEYSTEEGLFRVLEYDQSKIKRNYYLKTNGFSVRCVGN